MTAATACTRVSEHLYTPLIPCSDDPNARMLQSVAESGGLAMNLGLFDVHGECDMTARS